jgi:hypothetical protein
MVGLAIAGCGSATQPTPPELGDLPPDSHPVVSRPEPPPPRPTPRWDPPQAAKHSDLRLHHRERCHAGDLDSCDMYASMLRSGVGGRPDQGHALDVSHRACKLGHRRSCNLADAQRHRIRYGRRRTRLYRPGPIPDSH